MFKPSPLRNFTEKSLRFNNGPLKKHGGDNMCDRQKLDLTETQLLPNESTNPLVTQLGERFKCQFKTNGNKYKSIAVCYHSLVDITNHEKFDEIPTIIVTKHNFKNQSVALLVYRPTNGIVSSFFLKKEQH